MTAPDLYTAADIAIALRQTPNAVHRSARRLGVGRMLGNQRVFTDADLAALHAGRGRRYSDDEVAAVVRRYQDGETIAAIAEACDMPRSSVGLLLRRALPTRRARGRQTM
jgi:16S rRNA G1207 methylase RsmC